MKLGVVAAAASCLLPELIGPQRAFDLLVSGRSITGAQAAEIGLAFQTVADPLQAALAYFGEYIGPKSTSSLRHAIHAARFDYAARVRSKIAAVERLYLDELMKTHDAVEGLEAFDRVMGFHQFIEIEALDRSNLAAHSRRVVEPRCVYGVTKRAGAFGSDVFTEIGQCSLQR